MVEKETRKIRDVLVDEIERIGADWPKQEQSATDLILALAKGLARSGHKLDAIKLYRASTGASLDAAERWTEEQ
jgi:ribosomal protein L7/L12